MTEQTCVTDSCGRPVHDARVCRSCGDLLAQALGDVTALSDELDTTLSRQTGKSYRIGGKSDDTPLPYHEKAGEMTRLLRSTMVAWVKDLIGEGEAWPADTLPAISRWLLASVEDIRQREDGGTAVDELTWAVNNARRAIDRGPERVYAGPCPAILKPQHVCTDPVMCAADNADFACNASLYATLGKDRVTCAECEATYSVEERLTWMRAEVDGMLKTAAECAALGVAVRLWSNGNADKVRKRINTWGNRKRLEVHGLSLDGVPMYRFGEAVAMVLEREAA